jgi:hypothetical protein
MSPVAPAAPPTADEAETLVRAAHHAAEAAGAPEQDHSFARTALQAL